MLVESNRKWIILLPLGIWNMVDAGGEQWKVDYPLAFRDMEYSGFCGLVDADGCWWRVVENGLSSYL